MSDWLTAIIVLLIVIILADGFRRTYSARQNRLGMSPSLNKRAKEPLDESSPETYGSELPNGGARVIGSRDTLKPSFVNERKPTKKELREQRRREESARREPEQTHLDLEKSVPILMDSVAAEPSTKNAEQRSLTADERIEPTFSARASTDEKSTRSQALPEDDYEEDFDEEFDSSEDFDDDYEDEEDERGEYDDDVDESSATPAQPEEVFIINVMAFKGEFFNGNDLLDATLKCGLRYGNMDIFHRYSTVKGEGTLLFSMANMVKPGTFDLDAMDDFETPGVSLFMTLPIEADSLKSFELMVDTANTLAEALDGELKDEHRSAMTRQTIEHCRQRISDFERKKLFSRAR